MSLPLHRHLSHISLANHPNLSKGERMGSMQNLFKIYTYLRPRPMDRTFLNGPNPLVVQGQVPLGGFPYPSPFQRVLSCARCDKSSSWVDTKTLPPMCPHFLVPGFWSWHEICRVTCHPRVSSIRSWIRSTSQCVGKGTCFSGSEV